MDIEELRRKAELGSTVAQGILGSDYLWGCNVEVDYSEALRFLTAAAEKGASRSIMNLAHMYQQGLGVPRNTKKAIHLYEQVAEKNFEAAIALGEIYSNDNQERDPQLAKKWYKVAVGFEDTLLDCVKLSQAQKYIREEYHGGSRSDNHDLKP